MCSPPLNAHISPYTSIEKSRQLYYCICWKSQKVDIPKNIVSEHDRYEIQEQQLHELLFGLQTLDAMVSV